MFPALAIGNVVATVLTWLIVVFAYTIAYLKYFESFGQPGQRTAATIGFITLQLVFWGLILFLIRTATLR